MHTIRLAAIGTGLRFQILSNVLPLLGDRFKLVAVADTNLEALDAADPASADILKVQDHRELLHHPAIDAVLVLTPDFTHAHIGCDFLEAGKSVYIEKPMATSVAGADALLAASRRSGSKLYIGHNMRFMPVIEGLKSVIDEGSIGTPKTFWIRHFIGRGGDYFFKDWHSESSKSGGLLIHKASHDLDAMAYVLGTTFSKVQAVGANMIYHHGRMRPEGVAAPTVVNDPNNWPPLSQDNLNPAMDVEDLSLVNIVCENGILGAYQQCHFTPDYWRNYCVIGTEGRVENFGDTSDGGVIRVWNRRRKGYDPTPDLEFPIASDDVESLGHDGADVRILEDFYAYLHGAVSSRTSPLDARQVVALGEMARRSMHSASSLMSLSDEEA